MLIDVNHRILRNVAADINTYCTAQNREMRKADTEIKVMLKSGWLGQDALEFGRKWDGVNKNDSTAVKFRESLKNYAEALEACANEYQSAQADAVNSAGLLMRIVGR